MAADSIRLIFEGAAIVFAAGGAFMLLRRMRADVQDLQRKFEVWEARYRHILVALTAITALLPDNPGSKERIANMIAKMSNGGIE